MKIIAAFNNEEQFYVKNNLSLFFLGVGFSIICILLLYYGLRIELYFLVLGLIICLTSTFSFNTSYYFFLTLIFLPYIYALRIHPSVIFSLFLLFSALMNFKGDLVQHVKNPLWLPLLLYFITILPSFFNTPKPLLSLRDLSNLISLFIVIFVTILDSTTNKKMINVFYLYVVIVLLHSLHVIFQGQVTGKRAFGILGVYYIDFAGLGSLTTFILLLFNKGAKRVFFVLLFVIITLGLVVTGTRNAWISTAFAIITLIGYLFFNSKRVQIRKSVLVFFAVLIAGLIILSSVSSGVNVEKRLDVNKQTVTLTNDPESVGTNSFVSRIMIWHTAYSAFLKHPIIGIGVYAFKHTSQLYYVIPKGFYKLWVEGRTPHITYLQVLTETGIIGFIMFIIFIGSVIRYLISSLKLPNSKNDIMLMLMIGWSLVYIVFSMTMTESWLYGPYIVWFGVLLGFLITLRKRLENAQ